MPPLPVIVVSLHRSSYIPISSKASHVVFIPGFVSPSSKSSSRTKLQPAVPHSAGGHPCHSERERRAGNRQNRLRKNGWLRAAAPGKTSAQAGIQEQVCQHAGAGAYARTRRAGGGSI